MSKPTIPISEAKFQPWLEKVMGTPLHRTTPPKPPVARKPPKPAK